MSDIRLKVAESRLLFLDFHLLLGHVYGIVDGVPIVVADITGNKVRIYYRPVKKWKRKYISANSDIALMATSLRQNSKYPRVVYPKRIRGNIVKTMSRTVSYKKPRSNYASHYNSQGGSFSPR